MNVKDLSEWRHTSTFLCADLGKLQDYTAISIINGIERFEVLHDPRNPFIPSLRARKTGEVRFEVPYLHRLPIGTDYVAQVRFVQRLYVELGRKCKPRPVLVIDATGVGQPVADMFREKGLQPIEIWFTGGNRPTARAFGWNVPKSDTISALQRAIGRGELMIAARIPEAATLIEEATRMEAIQNPSGHIRYSHREGEHDDMVLSVGIGLWYAYWSRKNRIQSIPAGALGL
ncbi:MAG: hypothetical protein QM305_09410 [Bacteroidota bacterium]|nr:hypothetical protein [Bacteroidota bacterium]